MMSDRPGEGAFDEWKAGWSLPLVAVVGTAVVNMTVNSLGLFFGPLEQDFGWSRAQTASGLLVFSIVAVFAVPIMGRQVDLRGSRKIALPGVIFYCSVFAALGLTQPAIWSWLAIWMLLAVAAAWISPVVWVTAVASRFDKGRGLAIAITLTGAGISAVLAPLLSNGLIEAYNWRIAYAGMGVLFCAVLFPLVFFFFFSASDLNQHTGRGIPTPAKLPISGLSFREGIRNHKFIRLLIATFLIAFGLLALVVHFVPILTASGISTSQAAKAAAFIGVGSIVGRILTGFLLDRIHGTIVGFAVFSLPILVSLSLMHWEGDKQMVFAIAFLLGISLGGEVDVVAYLTSRYVGLKNFGSLFGISVSALAMAAGVGPWLAAFVYDIFGSYDYLLLGTIPVFLLAASLVSSLGAYPSYQGISANGD